MMDKECNPKRGVTVNGNTLSRSMAGRKRKEKGPKPPFGCKLLLL